MSETGITTSNPYDGDRIAGTVGYALPGVEARIVDTNGADVAAGEVGVVAIEAVRSCASTGGDLTQPPTRHRRRLVCHRRHRHHGHRWPDHPAGSGERHDHQRWREHLPQGNRARPRRNRRGHRVRVIGFPTPTSASRWWPSSSARGAARDADIDLRSTPPWRGSNTRVGLR